jgi:hypothetical protein
MSHEKNLQINEEDSFWRECTEQVAGTEKFGRLRWAGHTVAMTKKKSYEIFVEKLLRNGRLEDREEYLR